jgi:hypothetical protein
VSFGPLSIEGLKPGEYRVLDAKEVRGFLKPKPNRLVARPVPSPRVRPRPAHRRPTPVGSVAEGRS